MRTGNQGNTHRSRRAGFQLVMLALGAGLATFALAMAAATRSQSSRQQVGHLENQLEERDLMVSALAEAVHELSRALDDPEDERHAAVRSEGLEDLELPLALPHTRERALEEARDAALVVKARVEDRQVTFLEPGALPEWRANLVLTATMGERAEELVHELRAVRIGVPAPFDEACYHDYRLGEEWTSLSPTTFPPGSWESRALLRIDSAGDGGVNAAWADLRERLGALSGVLLVDNEAGDPLKLQDLRLRGRLVIVTRGPVEVVNVGPEDPSRDALTLIALGDAVLAGEVRARVVLSQEDGAADPARELALGLSVQGSLAIASASYEAVTDADLVCEERPFEGEAGREEAEGLHVVLSPDALGGWSE